MEQHFNPENSRTAAASAPLEKLMCWKETRSKKGKGQKEKGKGVAGEKKAQNRYQVDTAKPRMYEKPLVNF